PLGAALQFRHELESADCQAQISILEFGRLYDRLEVESGVLLISGLRKRITFSSVERNELRRGLKIAQSLGCEIVPSSNLVERGFTDIERLIRPPAMLAALFSANSDGFAVEFGSEALFRLIDSIEKEVQGIARSYGSIAPEFSRSILEIALGGEIIVADCQSNLASLLDRFGTRLMAIDKIDRQTCVELLKEDVEEVYCLLSDLGSKSRSTVGTIDSIIDLASAISGSDLRSRGRSLESLGLVGFDTREIIDLVNS
ncbi:MAG: hypothetical protein K8F91_18595, partial [Candidatus Obscuribacterales bacterium]|nr:hypothetical protein [Candidatus Obscuribacterales bacterium]